MLRCAARNHSWNRVCALDGCFNRICNMGPHIVQNEQSFFLAKESSRALDVALIQPLLHYAFHHPPLLVYINGDAVRDLFFWHCYPLKNHHWRKLYSRCCAAKNTCEIRSLSRGSQRDGRFTFLVNSFSAP